MILLLIICVLVILLRNQRAKTAKAAKTLQSTISGHNAELDGLREAYTELETTRPLRELGQSVAFINHEIKNYMMVISGYAALLQRSKTLDPKDRLMIDNIAEVTAKLQGLSQSILELSKSGATHGNTEFDLMQRLKTCVEAGFPKLPEKNFSLRCTMPGGVVLVNGSPEKIDKVFICALRNSLEAGARKVEVKVSVCNYVALAVIEDDGAGCGAAELQNLSTTFFTTKQGCAMGLGLCMIRSIVEAHGGDVSIYSKNLSGKNEHGLSVQITIPASKKTPYEAAEADVMLVKEGMDRLPGVNRILKNLKIIPHTAEKAKDADFASRSGSLKLIVLAAASAAGKLREKAGDNPGIKILSIEETEGGALLADSDDGRKDLFTEEYVVRCLYGG